MGHLQGRHLSDLYRRAKHFGDYEEENPEDSWFQGCVNWLFIIIYSVCLYLRSTSTWNVKLKEWGFDKYKPRRVKQYVQPQYTYLVAVTNTKFLTVVWAA
jgi:hypothetical protein